MAKFKRVTRKAAGSTSAKDARAASTTSRPSISSLLNLQQSAGNTATGRLIGGMLVQTKLESSTSEAVPDEIPEPGVPTGDTMPGAAPTPQRDETQDATGSSAALIVDDSVETVG